MTGIKAIVFDVDGVLINSKCENGEFYWKKNIHKDLGINIAQVKQFFKHYWPKIGAGELDTLDGLQEFLLSIGSGVKPLDFMNYWHEKDSNINLPIIELVKNLKLNGYDLYLGTNQEKYRSKHLWGKLGLSDHFIRLFASFELGVEKPNIKFFGAIEDELGLTSTELFFIDDSKNNVEAAISLGWKGICHTSNSSTLKFFNTNFLN